MRPVNLVSGGAIGLAIVAAASSCAGHLPPGVASNENRLGSGVALATFDTLWRQVATTYVDTAFVAHEWVTVRDSLRPRAAAISRRRDLEELLAETLHHIGDSHFYIIPAHAALDDATTAASDGRGTTGLSVRIAEGQLVAWKVEPGSASAVAGLKPGQRIIRIQGQDADSAMKRVLALPADARPRAMSQMLHSFNSSLTPGSGDTVRVRVAGRAAPFILVAAPGEGTVSQFGNLPPIAGLVRISRVASATSKGCVGVIAFNIWLPAMTADLERGVDSVRSCDGIVIDLRGNPGGVGAMVMGFGGYFVDSLKSLGTMRTRQVSLNFVINPRSSRADGRPVPPFDGKVAILVDPMTASTSEIFATGMQRIGRARVFGEKSAGAALPALMERLPSGDVFVHAVADFTDPTGRRVEGSGVVPDVIVPLRIEDLAAGRDAPLDSAVRWIEGRLN